MAQHNLLVKCSGEKFTFSVFKATIEIYCKFAGFKEKRVVPTFAPVRGKLF